MSKLTICITGASKGIGAAIARAFAEDGHRLLLNTGSDEAGLFALCEDLRALPSHPEIFPSVGDIGDAAYVTSFLAQGTKELGPVNILINNAGVALIGLLTDMTNEEWMRVMNTNLNSCFYTSRAVLPHMIHEKKGHIINITSIWGQVGASCEVAYSTSKGGLIAFTRALAKELAPSNIQVNAISCGVIDTRMNHCFDEEEREALRQEIPMDRFGTPEEVAAAVKHMVAMPDYVTGQILTIDGGYL
ncbi:MAG: SDR family oxidoreductase [Lachnospiraceae bacterium]|jgi:3-oxoacyl-[acyl-carrier protein] reductase|nr:SDR family oxidoreductase [Lachnospiraceae bacterium]